MNADSPLEYQQTANVVNDLRQLKPDCPVTGTISITIKSELPTGGGLGSSAAFAAAMFGALCKAVEFVLDVAAEARKECSFEDRVWGYTNVMEGLVHGTPSGVDAAIAIKGGMLCYRKARPPEVSQITQMNEHIPKL